MSIIFVDRIAKATAAKATTSTSTQNSKIKRDLGRRTLTIAFSVLDLLMSKCDSHFTTSEEKQSLLSDQEPFMNQCNVIDEWRECDVVVHTVYSMRT